MKRLGIGRRHSLVLIRDVLATAPPAAFARLLPADLPRCLAPRRDQRRRVLEAAGRLQLLGKRRDLRVLRRLGDARDFRTRRHWNIPLVFAKAPW